MSAQPSAQMWITYELESQNLHLAHGMEEGAEVGEEMILAKDLMGNVLRHKVEVISEIKGADLEGRKYVSPFPGAIDGDNHPAAWTVVAADFVTTTDGTGIVHTAVMYGEG